MSATCASLTWLLKPQNEVLYKKLIAFLHDRKSAPKWPLYKKLMHPTWFIHTTICLQWLGTNPFFLYKTIVSALLCGTQTTSKRRGNPNGGVKHLTNELIPVWWGCAKHYGQWTWLQLSTDCCHVVQARLSRKLQVVLSGWSRCSPCISGGLITVRFLWL